jgi:hypothetical protein
MTPPSHGTRQEEARKSGLRAQRLKVALVVLALFGLPLGLMLSYLALREAAFDKPFGDQPGGRIAGTVEAESGGPLAGVRVDVFTQRRAGLPELKERVFTDDAGRFAVEVPPLDGCYGLLVGGGLWVVQESDLTLEDDAFPDLAFTLAPGTELAVALTRKAGSRIEGGRFFLFRAGGLLGLPMPTKPVTGEFSGEGFTRGGLEPGKWTLAVELEDGTKAEWTLELAAGRVELELPL